VTVIELLEREMKPPDKRRVLASAAVLLAMPFFVVCGLCHFCIGGHMAHPPYQWHHFANDFGWLTFFVIALVFAFRSNIPARMTFVVLTVIMFALHILGAPIVALFMAVPVIGASIQGLKNRERSSNSMQATPSGAPDG